MSQKSWSVFRLIMLVVLYSVITLFFPALGVVLFGAHVVGGIIAVFLEWREYKDDNRPSEFRGEDVFTWQYAVEVFCGWPLPSLMKVFCVCSGAD